MFNRVRIFWIAFSAIALALSAPAQDVTLDSDTLSGLPIRAIGPAATGGRIADIAAVHEGLRPTIYVGSASGGVWKSVDGGTTFKPIFDKQPSLSIGSVAIDPEKRLGGNRRVVGAQQRFGGDGDLPLARWR